MSERSNREETGKRLAGWIGGCGFILYFVVPAILIAFAVLYLLFDYIRRFFHKIGL